MSGAEKVNILIVDDLPEKVLVIRSVLEVLEENIIVAFSGTEALRQVLEHEFAVILLDVNMPDIDGLETASLIRRRKKTAHTPIIFVTAYADEMHTAQGYSLGAVDYILSPVVPEVLRTKVKVFVDLFRMNQQVKRQAEERIVLAQEQAARAAAEDATRRSNFLARASTALTASLDAEGTVDSLLSLAVPEVADVAAVTLTLDPTGRWDSRLAWVFPPDPQLHRGLVTAPEAPDDVLREAVERALASGHSEVLNDLSIPYPPIGAEARPGHAIRSALVLPLRARGRTLGALTLALACSGRRFTAADQSLAEDLAGRAAIALDNARLYRSLQEADRHKNEFLAMLAHELRNPLAPIRNAVEVMRMIGPTESPLVQARDMIDRQVTHMARLVDDLLDTSRISRGKVLLRTEILDLVRLVADVADDHRRSLEAIGLRVDVSLPEGSLWTEGDPTRLAQVVGNVLHNAGKFTDPGGHILLDMRLERERNTACIEVQDSGIGMEPSMLARVFETFTQADRSLDRSRGGLGLGLALVRGLVELHGGEVWAYSAGPGQGTKISIRLPLCPAAASPAPPTAPSEGSAVPPCRVLLIEDNADAAASMHMLLTLTGHEVTVASTGPAGLRAAREFDPDVVVCDIGLPGGMDGYAVARAMRGELGMTAAYLIALTGYGQDEDKQSSLGAGFNAHLTKPVDFSELQALLTHAPVRA